MGKTMFEKIWDSHIVAEPEDQPALIYIDLHLVHEVTSPQAFEALRIADREVRRPDLTISTVDHNLPTDQARTETIKDPVARQQVDALRKNCEDFGVTLYDVDSSAQGIVHVIGPEQGYTQPGMTIVCGDSHTSTHGAFGSLAFRESIDPKTKGKARRSRRRMECVRSGPECLLRSSPASHQLRHPDGSQDPLALPLVESRPPGEWIPDQVRDDGECERNIAIQKKGGAFRHRPIIRQP